jgi:hypothetical protein
MEPLTEAQCRRWCLDKGLELDPHKRPDLFLGKKHVRQFKIPNDAGARVALVREHLEPFRKESKVLVWLDEWGVFPSGERMHVFDRFRLSYGITAPLIEKRGHELRREEFEDTTSFVTLAVLFLWDCYVLTPSGRPALWFSHDEVGYVAV